MDSNPDSDHLSHVDCDPDSNPDSGPGARVNAAIVMSCLCIAHLTCLSLLCARLMLFCMCRVITHVVLYV